MWIGSLYVLAVLGIIAGVQSRKDATSWGSCQRTVCERVVQESDGLARVKLLRGYVTETVKLLDSLMVSLDHELVDIAKDIKDFVGPRCVEAHAALSQVAEPVVGEELDLSAGIMEESTAQALESDQLSVDITPGSGAEGSSREGSSAFSIWRTPSGRQLTESTTYSDRKGQPLTQTNSWNNNNNEHDDSREYADHHRFTSEGDEQHRGSNSYPTNDGYQAPRINSKQPRQQQNWRGPSGSNRTPTSTHFYNGSSSQKRPGSTLGATSWAPVPTSRSCIGLPGSPFTVPGIDNWCAENCVRGYCPATHCVCN